jgi:hypothetical protein
MSSGEKLYLDSKDVEADFRLSDQDAMHVANVTDLLPVLFVEGAIGAKPGDNPEASTRIPVSFNPGEDIATIQEKKELVHAGFRHQERLSQKGRGSHSLNLNPMLYDASFRSTLVIQNNDTLVIPFYQYFVTVSAQWSVGQVSFIRTAIGSIMSPWPGNRAQPQLAGKHLHH